MILNDVSQPRRLKHAVAVAALGLSLGLGLLGAGTALAQAQPGQAGMQPLPHNVVQLSATARQQARQDWLTLTLAQRVQGTDPVALQRQLSRSVEAALQQLRPQVRSGEFELSSGGFTLQPRHNAEGQIVGWLGAAEVLVQGRDLAALAAVPAQVRGLSVSQLQFTLSPQARQQLEAGVRSAAIERFRASAQLVARDFGFSGYTLREVVISAAEPEWVGRPRLLMAAPARLDTAEVALPAEPGSEWVHITVSGAVQLH